MLLTSLLYTCASEEFIDSIIAPVQAVESSCAKGLTQIFLHGITADVEPHTADLADTLPWMCPNDTGISGEAPKPAGPTDISYWNSVGAKQKSSTPARTWGLTYKGCVRTLAYALFHVNDQMYQERNERGNVRCLTQIPGLSYALFYSCCFFGDT